MTDTWIERVKAADAEAEHLYVELTRRFSTTEESVESTKAHALIAITAELRAARIARRPGAGQ